MAKRSQPLNVGKTKERRRMDEGNILFPRSSGGAVHKERGH
jgi:hypothetical protein